MKSTAKKTKKATVKKTAKAKVGQKSTAKRAKKAEPAAEAHSMFMNTEVDVAHSPGHKKMNLKETTKPGGGKSSFMQNKNASPKKPSVINRRIITGAAIGKTGRIVEV